MRRLEEKVLERRMPTNALWYENTEFKVKDNQKDMLKNGGNGHVKSTCTPFDLTVGQMKVLLQSLRKLGEKTKLQVKLVKIQIPFYNMQEIMRMRFNMENQKVTKPSGRAQESEKATSQVSEREESQEMATSDFNFLEHQNE